MRHVLALAALAALAACETVPEFMQPTNQPASLTPPSAQTAQTPTTFAPPPDQQLLELERQLSATAQERGLGAAMAGVIDTNAGISIRPGAVYTAADIEQGLAAPPGAGPIYWQADRVHVSSSGDMGVTSGRYVQVMTGREAIQGRYVVVWRREPGGQWRALTETRVPDPPRATPTPRRR
jgi:hypothetical protein